jgi:single-strand DNA-binding protein
MSLNKVILIGNVGKDPEIRYIDNNRAVANFSLATNDRAYKTSNGTEIPERTDWHSIVAFRETAQFVEKHVKKGSGLCVEGKIRYRNYEKDGVKRYVTEIYADRVEFYSTGNGGRRDEQNGTAAGGAGSSGAPKPGFSEPGTAIDEGLPPLDGPQSDPLDDDIPF